MFNTKKNISAIIGAVFLSSATIAGSGTNLYFAYKNYSESSEFQKSYNLRFELDLQTTENPYEKVTTDEEQIKAKLDETGKRFALHLRNEYNKTFNVYTEYYKENNVPHAFLDVVVPNEKKTDPFDDNNKIDVLRETIFEKYESTQRISILYSDAVDSYYDFTKDFLFGKDDDITLSDNKKQVNLKLRDDRHFDKIRETFTPDKPSSNADEYVPYMYILRDQNGLINHMNYILQLSKTATGGTYKSSLYDELTQSEKSFWNDFYEDKTGTTPEVFTNLKVKDPANYFDDIESAAVGEIESGDALNPKWIEGSEASGRFIDHTGTVKYDFVKPYILGIIAKEKYDETDLGLATFNKVFPLKNPTDAKKDAENGWMVLSSINPSQSDAEKPDSERYSATKLQKDLTSFYSYFPLLTHNSVSSFTKIIGNENTFPSNINVLNPSFADNVFGNPPLLGAVICLAILVLMVGILVSVLYRIPGLFGFLFTMFAISLSILLITLSGFLVSASLVCGLFIGLLIGLMTIVTCFQKAKEQVRKGMTIFAAVKKSFAKSFMAIFDLTIVVLICGVGLTYLAGTEFLSLGVLLILVSLFSFVFVYGGTFLVTFLMFWKAKIGSEPQHLMLRESFVNKCALNSPNTTTTFGGNKLPFKKFNLFNKKVLIVIGSIFAVFILVGIIVSSVIGNINATDFFEGSRIMIRTSTNADEILARLAEWNCRFDGTNGDYLVFFSTSVVSLEQIRIALTGLTFSTLNVSQSVSTSFNDYAVATVGTGFAIVGMLTAYSFIRFGWVSIIPTFILLVLVPAITILFFVTFQIYFDANIVVAIIITFVIGSIMVFNALGNIFHGNFRKQTGSFSETMSLLNTEFKNDFVYYATIAVFGLVSTLLMSFIISTTILSFSFIIFFGIIVSMFFIFYGLPQMLILFIPIKNKYRRRIDTHTSPKNSLDKIDEQLIDGINFESDKPF